MYHTIILIAHLIARAREVALRSFSVALEVQFHIGGAPTFYPILGSHEGGAHAIAVVVAELDCARTE